MDGSASITPLSLDLDDEWFEEKENKTIVLSLSKLRDELSKILIMKAKEWRQATNSEPSDSMLIQQKLAELASIVDELLCAEAIRMQ